MNQTFGLSSAYSEGFSIANFPPDGLMGLAFPQISTLGANPVFQNLMSQDQLLSPVFSFKLGTSDSELYLGGVDSTAFTGEVTKTPVTQVVSAFLEFIMH